MPRKPRSPLRGMSHDDLARLRSCVRETLNWERALGTPNQYLEPVYKTFVHELRFSLIEQVKDRSYRRWRKAEHFPESHRVHRDQHMQKYDRRAWELNQLRAELDGYRAMVAQLHTEVTGLRAVLTGELP